MPTQTPFFLLGAGFGADAGGIVGPIEAESIYIGRYQHSCAYPLVRDLPALCFPDAEPPVPVAEVEKRLGEAIAEGRREALGFLERRLGAADYYLAPRLVGKGAKPNAYNKFFADWPDSSFGTFNYDALVEYALFQAGRWSPHDGYGVTVATDLAYTAQSYTPRPSTCLVLHLHGCYAVYAYEHTFGPPDKNGVQWMQLFEQPRFAFDPGSESFFPFQRFMAGLAYNPDTSVRVVAPIPDKTQGLKAEFIRQVVAKAKKLIAQAGCAVAIGYAFAAHDKASYTELLGALGAVQGARMHVVAPDAEAIVGRLKQEYPNIVWTSSAMGFAQWVEAGYPGTERTV